MVTVTEKSEAKSLKLRRLDVKVHNPLSPLIVFERKRKQAVKWRKSMIYAIFLLVHIPSIYHQYTVILP